LQAQLLVQWQIVQQVNGQRINLQVASIVLEGSNVQVMQQQLFVKLELSQMVIKELVLHVLLDLIVIPLNLLKQDLVHLVKYVHLLLRLLLKSVLVILLKKALQMLQTISAAQVMLVLYKEPLDLSKHLVQREHFLQQALPP
jgi:hypothetical protein